MVGDIVRSDKEEEEEEEGICDVIGTGELDDVSTPGSGLIPSKSWADFAGDTEGEGDICDCGMGDAIDGV